MRPILLTLTTVALSAGLLALATRSTPVTANDLALAPVRCAAAPGAFSDADLGQAAPSLTSRLTSETRRVTLDAPERPRPAVPRAAQGGDGTTAGLRGRLTRNGVGVAASIEFVCGPNRGTTIDTQADGSFRAPALYPGFAVYVARLGAATCRREIRLRHGAELALELDFRPGVLVSGRVLDEEGRPVAGARVALDGRVSSSGADGGFALEAAVSGRPLLSVRAPGYVAFRESLEPGSGECEVELRRGARATLSITGGEGELQVYLFPTGGERMSGRRPEPAFPWHELNPIRIAPGSTLELADLPLTRVEAVAFGAGSRSAPVSAWLSTAEQAAIALELLPVPHVEGRVTRGGEPVAGAQVAWRPANPLRATQVALGDLGRFYLAQPIELLPFTRQTAVADGEGRFELAHWDLRSGASSLTFTTAESSLTRELADLRSADLDADLARLSRGTR